MSRKNVVGNIKFSHFDDLFGEPDSVRESDIVEIPLTELYGFKNHPFKIRSDEELSEMIDSVRKYGVLVPGIARGIEIDVSIPLAQFSVLKDWQLVVLESSTLKVSYNFRVLWGS